MSADKPYRCVSPISATQIHNKTWTSDVTLGIFDVTQDQCNVNVTDLHTGKLALVPCTAWEFEEDGRFTLKVRAFYHWLKNVSPYAKRSTLPKYCNIFLRKTLEITYYVHSRFYHLSIFLVRIRNYN